MEGEMIHLYQYRQRVGGFNSFEALIDYLNRYENSNLMDYNCYQSSEKWAFIYHSYKQPSNDHQQNDDTDDLLEPSDWLEYYLGDPNEFYQVTVTEETDVLDVMRDWCIEYCFAHNFTVLESHSYDKPLSHGQTSSHPLNLAKRRHREENY
jgi:hypothetical protein